MQKLSQEKERALIAGAQAGNREMMEEIVVQYWPLVLAAGHQRAVRSIAEDATGAAAEELVRCVHAFDLSRGVPFAAYAKVRVYGAVSHLLRKMQTMWAHECAPSEANRLEGISKAGGATSEAIATTAQESGRSIEQADARLTLAPLLAKLPPMERRVLAILYARGLSTYEAADVLGVSQSKIARWKRSALARMREGLKR